MSNFSPIYCIRPLAITLFNLCLFSCENSTEPKIEEPMNLKLIGFELIDASDNSSLSTSFIYNDTLITGIQITETGEIYWQYNYDQNGRLIESYCPCSDEKRYSYQNDKVASMNQLDVSYMNDSIFIDNSFYALINNGNVVNNYFSERMFTDLEIPISFKHFYSIFFDEHYPIFKDSNLLDEYFGDRTKTTFSYELDGSGYIRSLTMKGYEDNQLLGEETYLFNYE